MAVAPDTSTPIHAARSIHGTSDAMRATERRVGTGDSLPGPSRSRRVEASAATMTGMVRPEAETATPTWAGWLSPGATLGVGGLPHRNPLQAAEFALASYDIATLPSLPRRSPAESTIGQALAGVAGVAFGRHGDMTIDVARLDPQALVVTDLGRSSLRRVSGVHPVGERTFLYRSGGVALCRPGVSRVALMRPERHLIWPSKSGCSPLAHMCELSPMPCDESCPASPQLDPRRAVGRCSDGPFVTDFARTSSRSPVIGDGRGRTGGNRRRALLPHIDSRSCSPRDHVVRSRPPPP
jgi:hypothetical protein